MKKGIAYMQHNMKKKYFQTHEKIPILISAVLIVGLWIFSFHAFINNNDEILTTLERSWLNRLDSPLVYVPCPDYPPIEFLDSNNINLGITADYISKIEEILDYQFMTVNVNNWSELIQKIESGECDIVGSILQTPDRLRYMNFTDPYFNVKTVFVTRKDFIGQISEETIADYKISVTTGYAVSEFLSAKYPEITLIHVPTDLDGLYGVSFGESDIMVSDLPVATYLIGSEGLTNLKIAGDVGFTYNISFGTKKEIPILNTIISKALNSISHEERTNIVERWINWDLGKVRMNKQLWRIILIVLTITLGVAFFVLLWDLSLNKEVRERTMELKGELVSRQRVEKELLESQLFLTNLMSNLPGMVYRSNKDMWQMEFVSNGCYAITGYTPEEVSGHEPIRFSSLILQNEIERITTEIQSAVSQERQFECMYPIHNKNDQLRWIRQIGSGFYNDATPPQCLGYIGFITDITDSMKKDLQLQQAQKMDMIGTLASGIAHDFNNILCGITGTISLLKLELEKYRDPEVETEELIQVLEQASNRASEIVQQILSLSRKQEMTLSPLNLNIAIDNVMKICSNTFDKLITIQVSPSNIPAMVSADHTQIEQALLNLCVNAAHSMTLMRPVDQKRGGTLILRLDAVGLDTEMKERHPEVSYDEFWAIAVSDTGIGMNEETRSRIFEPFFTTKKRGTGNGLGMVMNIIKQHGGFIEVSSIPEKGTEIKVYLPVSSIKDDGKQELQKRIIKNKSGLVLVIDDEEMNINIITRMLSHFGYNVITARNGKEGIDIFRKQMNDILFVILDMIMPEKGGFETYIELKNLRQTYQ